MLDLVDRHAVGDRAVADFEQFGLRRSIVRRQPLEQPLREPAAARELDESDEILAIFVEQLAPRAVHKDIGQAFGSVGELAQPDHQRDVPQRRRHAQRDQHEQRDRPAEPWRPQPRDQPPDRRHHRDPGGNAAQFPQPDMPGSLRHARSGEIGDHRFGVRDRHQGDDYGETKREPQHRAPPGTARPCPAAARPTLFFRHPCRSAPRPFPIPAPRCAR